MMIFFSRDLWLVQSVFTTCCLESLWSDSLPSTIERSDLPLVHHLQLDQVPLTSGLVEGLAHVKHRLPGRVCNTG